MLEDGLCFAYMAGSTSVRARDVVINPMISIRKRLMYQ